MIWGVKWIYLASGQGQEVGYLNTIMNNYNNVHKAIKIVHHTR